MFAFAAERLTVAFNERVIQGYVVIRQVCAVACPSGFPSSSESACLPRTFNASSKGKRCLTRGLESDFALARQFEIDRNLSLNVDGLPIQVIRFVLPLLHCVLGCASEHGVPAQHLDIRDVASLGDGSLQLHRSFFVKLHRLRRITRRNALQNETFGDSLRNLHNIIGRTRNIDGRTADGRESFRISSGGNTDGARGDRLF